MSEVRVHVLHLTAGIPQIYHFGQEGLHNILVIDLLGPSLEDLFDMCGRKFSIKTTCMVAKQMVRLFRAWGGAFCPDKILRRIVLLLCDTSCHE